MPALPAAASRLGGSSMVRASFISFLPLQSSVNQDFFLVNFDVFQPGADLRHNGFPEPVRASPRYLHALYPLEHPQYEELAERLDVTGCEPAQCVVFLHVLLSAAETGQKIGVVIAILRPGQAFGLHRPTDHFFDQRLAEYLRLSR